MNELNKSSILIDFFIPTILFTSLGLFSWAIRGQSGYGAFTGCTFAGLMWGTAWFLLSRESSTSRSRRYSSGWSVILIIAGIGLAGMRGWMQWPSWYDGRFVIDYYNNITLPINPAYGWIWMFLTGISWGGIGAVLLSWAGSKKSLSRKEWVIRIIFVGGGYFIGYMIFSLFPQWFLPLYDQVSYFDPNACPQCERVIGDNRSALAFLGAYLGGLLFELFRKDWMNVKLISIVGLISGFGWMIDHYIAFHWLPEVTGFAFNWWRVWESTGGGVIGFGYGIAYYVCNKKLPDSHPDRLIQAYSSHPNAEKLIGVYFGLTFGFIWSINAGIKGYLNIYYSIDSTLIGWALPITTLIGGIWCLSIYNTIKSPAKINDMIDHYSNFPGIFLTIYFVHRELGLGVTGPLSNWAELVYFIYYLLLSIIDFIILTIWYKNTR